MNPMQLFEVAPRPIYVWCLSYAWVGPELYVEKNFFISYSFDFISEAHESKEGICRYHILYPLWLGSPFPNDAQTLRPKNSLEPN